MSATNKKIKEKLKNLPLCPGVYIMYNSAKDVIYVGKSKLLKNRVSSYFMNSKNHTPKTIAMVSHVADFEYIITDTEVEALVLECNLIKKYKPKYNILLKDDKQYPYIKLTLKEDFPRVSLTRNVVNDGSAYFGPYISSYNAKNALEAIKSIFKVRSCTKKISSQNPQKRPCLYYQIGRCSAPCCGYISKEDYRDFFDKIADVLNGKYSKLINQLKDEMQKASDNLEFEKAARYRDKITAVNSLGEKQKMTSAKDINKGSNKDIIGVYKDEADICIQVFYMREGKIQGTEHFVLKDDDSTISEILSEFIKQFYFIATNIPPEILICDEIEDKNETESWLKEKTGYKISIITPQKGEKAKLIETAVNNAKESLKQYVLKLNTSLIDNNNVLKELKNKLSLKKIPFIIESYDISNISGAQSVGVCVVYKNAAPLKKHYKKFNIKTVVGADDYKSTNEVISRRINNAYREMQEIENGTLDKEKAKFLPLPDLILLDGGKEHVSSVRLLMETMGEEDIPVFGLVKNDKHKTRALTDDVSEYPLNVDSSLYRFLYGIQEEVHRFAITAFRNKHEKAGISSVLEEIKGIGQVKRKKLLQTFITIDNIKNATEKELSDVVGKNAAKNVYDYFKNNNQQ